jgi:hypothetical protein
MRIAGAVHCCLDFVGVVSGRHLLQLQDFGCDGCGFRSTEDVFRFIFVRFTARRARHGRNAIIFNNKQYLMHQSHMSHTCASQALAGNLSP